MIDMGFEIIYKGKKVLGITDNKDDVTDISKIEKLLNDLGISGGV